MKYSTNQKDKTRAILSRYAAFCEKNQAYLGYLENLELPIPSFQNPNSSHTGSVKLFLELCEMNAWQDELEDYDRIKNTFSLLNEIESQKKELSEAIHWALTNALKLNWQNFDDYSAWLLVCEKEWLENPLNADLKSEIKELKNTIEQIVFRIGAQELQIAALTRCLN